MKLGADSGYQTLVLWEADFVGMSDKEVVEILNRD
jgi:hypothetical protein